MVTSAPVIKKTWYSALLLPLLYGVCMAIVIFQEHLFADFDGAMHYFAGEDIFKGNGYSGWGSHFWPPLFSLLSGSLARWMDGTQAAGLISVISAALLLWVTHRFVRMLTRSNTIACLAQLLVAINFVFVQLSVKAENHMLEALFYVLAIYLLLQSLEKNDWSRYFLTGIVCGLAGLSRYTSYSLIPAFVLTLFCFYPLRRAAVFTAAVLAGFILVSSPWWIVNYFENGSPFATWQYMNVGAGVFAGTGSKWWWYWSGIDRVNSVTDIMLQRPGGYLFNFSRNVVKSVYLIVTKSQLTGIICIAALIMLIYKQYRKQGILLLRDRLFLPIVISLVCYIILVSQAFVFDEVFVNWLVMVVIYGTYALHRLNIGVLFRRSYRLVMILLLLLVISLDVFYTNVELHHYLADTTGMEENRQIVEAIRAREPDLEQKVVMTIHPARAYYLRSGYIMLPPYYQGDVNGLVTYKGMSFKVRDHAPRFPSTISINDLKVDYLIYDSWAAKCLPQFSFLLNKNSNRIPAGFQLVYLSPNTAVYKINKQLVDQKQ